MQVYGFTERSHKKKKKKALDILPPFTKWRTHGIFFHIFLQKHNVICVSLSSSCVDMAKRAGQVGFRSGQSGHGSKQVNRVAGQTGCRLSRVASWVKLTRIFQKKNFFFLK